MTFTVKQALGSYTAVAMTSDREAERGRGRCQGRSEETDRDRETQRVEGYVGEGGERNLAAIRGA